VKLFILPSPSFILPFMTAHHPPVTASRAYEELRLEALYRFELLDTPRNERLDRISQLLCALLDVEFAGVSLVDKERIFLASAIGFEGVSELLREGGFCDYATQSPDPLVVPDASIDPRFKDHALVNGGLNLRFYVGLPLKTDDEFAIGTLWALDRNPRYVSKREFKVLHTLADLVMNEFSLHLASLNLKKEHSARLTAEKLAVLGRVSSGIAHEIKTPLQYINSNIKYIQTAEQSLRMMLQKLGGIAVTEENCSVPLRDCSSAKQWAEELDLEYTLQQLPLAIQETQIGVTFLEDIVRTMGRFVHAPDQQQKHSASNVNAHIRDVLLISKSVWKKSCEMHLDLMDDPPLVPCNPGEIRQVILNLITNAVDAIEDRSHKKIPGMGYIRITTQLKEHLFSISVEDDGGGIPPHILDRIFSPFFTTKAVGKGSGQGLAICREIIEHHHGGQLLVESSESEMRTVFTILLALQSKS